MLDIKWIRENRDLFDENMSKKGSEACADKIIELDEERRVLVTKIQLLQAEKNKKVAELAKIKDKTSAEFNQMKQESSLTNDEMQKLEAQLSRDSTLQDMLDRLPNILASDVPAGTDESMNKVIRSYGIVAEFANAKEHFELGEELGMMDFTQTAKISGSRFVTLRSDLVRLERALVSFMIDIHRDKFKFEEIAPPYLVKPEAMYGVGQLPKFADESFETREGFRLIPTAEVPLTNMVADMILRREQLPIRMVAHTPCFRSEAGSAGRDTKGMIRLHQFNKVELVSITAADESEAEHEYLTNCAEEILKQLELPYRVLLLCSGDTGFASKKTYDLEVWLPGQRKYREISSCSNFGDFQARRMKARYKEFNATNTTFVHTINGSGLAIGRTIVAIMENYQNADGSITIPNALLGYMNGMTKIQKAVI